MVSAVRWLGPTIIFVIVLLDATTTYIGMNMFGTCDIETNTIVRNMCYCYGYVAPWLWAPMEFTGMLLGYYFVRRFRLFLNSVLHTRAPPFSEIALIAMLAKPVINNAVLILYGYTLSDALAPVVQVLRSVLPI